MAGVVRTQGPNKNIPKRCCCKSTLPLAWYLPKVEAYFWTGTSNMNLELSPWLDECYHLLENHRGGKTTPAICVLTWRFGWNPHQGFCRTPFYTLDNGDMRIGSMKRFTPHIFWGHCMQHYCSWYHLWSSKMPSEFSCFSSIFLVFRELLQGEWNRTVLLVLLGILLNFLFVACRLSWKKLRKSKNKQKVNKN